MTYPINNASEGVEKLKAYINDERPLNINEMQFLLAVIEPVIVSTKRIVQNVNPGDIPGWLLNDLITIRQKI